MEDQGDNYNHYVDVVAMVREERNALPDYRWLSSFIEPFTMGDEPLYHVEFMDSAVMGLPSVGYCVYSKAALRFNHHVRTALQTLKKTEEATRNMLAEAKKEGHA